AFPLGASHRAYRIGCRAREMAGLDAAMPYAFARDHRTSSTPLVGIYFLYMKRSDESYGPGPYVSLHTMLAGVRRKMREPAGVAGARGVGGSSMVMERTAGMGHGSDSERAFAQFRDRRGRTSVLVIDDEPQIRRFLRAGYELEGYEVREAVNGSDGIKSAT